MYRWLTRCCHSAIHSRIYGIQPFVPKLYLARPLTAIFRLAFDVNLFDLTESRRWKVLIVV